MRVLIIDKTAVLAANHERFAELAARGVQLTVLSPRVWIEHGRKVAAEVRESTDYEIVLGRTMWKGYYGRGMYLTGLARALRRARPEIVQLLDEPYSLFAAQTMRKCRLWARRARILFYTWENIYRDWKYPSRISRLYARVDRRMHRRAAGGVCATRQAERVLRLKGFSKTTAVIPYGVGRDFFAAGEARDGTASERPFTVGYLGRMLAMKGVEDLLTAFSTTFLRDARLELWGAGADEARLTDKARSVGVLQRATFHPPAPPEEIPALLSQLDALVLPSRTTRQWSEQLGRVLIEAMAAGVPVVGADSGAIPEVLDDAGLLYPEGQSRALAQRLAFIRDHAEGRAHLVAQGRARAAARFTWARFAEDFIAFWQKVLRESAP